MERSSQNMTMKANWETIRQEYRIGQLSVREIGRQHRVPESTIRYKAKQEQWTRDLTERVKEAVRSQLVRSEEVYAREAKEQEIVRAAVSRAVGVVKLHRSDAKKLREVIADLTRILRERIPNKDIILDIDGLKDASIVSRNLATAQKQIVGIERQAYGLDVKGEDGTTEIKVNIISFATLLGGGNATS
jgi:hypothetical protein